MQRAPAEYGGVVVGQLLEPERALDDIGMALGQRQHALDSQEVRDGQEVDVQHVALQELGFGEQLAQQRGLRADLNAERRFHGLGGGHLVSHAANAADAADDPGHLGRLHALDEVLEEAVGFRDGELHFLDNALFGVDNDPSVPFDAGDVLDIDCVCFSFQIHSSDSSANRFGAQEKPVSASDILVVYLVLPHQVRYGHPHWRGEEIRGSRRRHIPG